MPPIVVAAIIGAGATVGATAYGAHASGKASDKAGQREDKRIGEAMDWEKELEKRREFEVDRQYDEEKRQWDVDEENFRPYREAGVTAIGKLSDLANSLGGRNPRRSSSVASMLEGLNAGGAPTGSPSSLSTGVPWRASETVRGTAPAMRQGVMLSQAMDGTAPASSGSNNVGDAVTTSAQKIADIIRELDKRSTSNRGVPLNYANDAYLG